MTLLWDVGARKTAGVRRPWLGMLVRDAAPAFASLVLVSLAVYLASWTGWFLSDAQHAYNRDWAQDHPGPWFVPDALVSLWHYHQEVYNFHSGLDVRPPLPVQPVGLAAARPAGVLLLPGPEAGEDGCDVDQCSQAVAALGTPAIWWAACLPCRCSPTCGQLRRDWRAADRGGVVAGSCPGSSSPHRTIFSFYAVVFVPFLVLAVTMSSAWSSAATTSSGGGSGGSRPPRPGADRDASLAYLLR